MARGFGAVACAAIAATTVLTGCSKTSGSAAGGAMTLTVQQQAGDNNAKAIQTAITLFEQANPGVKVSVQTVTNDAKTGSNMAVLSGTNPPDVGFIPAGSVAYTQLVAANKLLPLDDVWSAAGLTAGYGDLAPGFTAPDGHPYIVSIDRVYYNIVYYNKDLFAAAGIATPADHRIASADQLYGMVAALKAKGKQGLAVGGASGYEASWMVDALLPTSADKAQMANYLTSWQPKVDLAAKYTDAPFVNVLSQLKDYNDHSVFQTGFVSAKAADAEAQFSQGNTGMLLDGNWSAATQRAADKFTLGWLLLPPMDPAAKTQLSAYAGDAMGIPTGAKNPALAKKFLEFLMSPQVQQKAIVEQAGNLPGINTLPASATASLDPLVQQMTADVAANGAQPGWTSTVPGANGQTLIDPLILGMYSGQKTPAQIAAAVQAGIDATRAAK